MQNTASFSKEINKVRQHYLFQHCSFKIGENIKSLLRDDKDFLDEERKILE